jgi:hypothetical protein
VIGKAAFVRKRKLHFSGMLIAIGKKKSNLRFFFKHAPIFLTNSFGSIRYVGFFLPFFRAQSLTFANPKQNTKYEI